MTRAQILRLIWIDMFIEDGEFLLRREHLRLAFDISIPQASIDLKRFAELFPGRLHYDKSRKGYIAASGSYQAFDSPSHSAVALACSAAAKYAQHIEHLSSVRP